MNCLNGFDNDVNIRISSNEQIGNIIEIVRQRISPYNEEEHKRIVRQELEERGYEIEMIEEWIDYI